MHTESSPEFSGHLATDTEFLLAAGLQTASFYLGLADEALRHTPISAEAYPSDPAALHVLTFLNDCTTKNLSVQHALSRIAEDLKRLHLDSHH